MSIGIAMMQPIQMGSGHHPALAHMRGLRMLLMELAWNPLVNALMSPLPIVIAGIFLHNATQLLLSENEEMITALASQTAHETLLDSIGSGCLERRSQFLDT